MPPSPHNRQTSSFFALPVTNVMALAVAMATNLPHAASNANENKCLHVAGNLQI
jgi:hypothetical protein